MENVGESAREHLLPRVRLRAFSAIPRAVIVHVLAFLQFPDEKTAAMTTVDQSRVREIVLHFSRAIRGACVEQLLDTLPGFAAH